MERKSLTVGIIVTIGFLMLVGLISGLETSISDELVNTTGNVSAGYLCLSSDDCISTWSEVGGGTTGESTIWTNTSGYIDDNNSYTGVIIDSGDLNMSENNITGIGNENTFNVNDSDMLDGEDGTYYIQEPQFYPGADALSLTNTGTSVDLSGVNANNSDMLDGEDGSYYLDNTDTNASTACSGIDAFLSGDGTCETDSDTTYTAGDFLGLSGTTFNVQETWVDESGDSMTGDLNMTGNNVTDVDCVRFSNGAKWCGT